MRSGVTTVLFSGLLVLSVFFSSGCNISENVSDTIKESSNSSTNSTESSVPTSTNKDTDSVPEKTKPNGEPTMLIGLDGEAVYTSEITEMMTLLGEPIGAEDFFETIGATAVCEGFVYLKESTGISYNTYENPELFDDYFFTGETPVNANKWRRVNVGDTICGLTLKSAKTGFRINDQLDFPEKYFDPTNQYCEFEGEITLTGFLYITPRNLYEPDGGTMSISFVDAALPTMAVSLKDDLSGYDSEFYEHTEGDGSLWGYTEYGSIYFDETMQKTSVDLNGLGIGDVSKVKVKISGLKLDSSGYASAHLEDIEVLSDVIIHVDDHV